MNVMKKILVAILAVALIASVSIGLFACGNDNNNSGNEQNNQESKKQLFVGLECAYAPFNYTQTDDANGAVPIYNANHKKDVGYANGYDVMIAKKIATDLNMELCVVKLEWDALIPALKAGTIDMIIAGMSPTAERKESIDFSDNYYTSQLVVVVRKDGNYANANSLSDLNGAKIVAQAGTFHLDALNAAKDANGIVVPAQYAQGAEDFPAMINALNTKVIDGYVAEEPGAIENCASNDAFTYVKLVNNTTGFTCTDDDTAIAVGIKKGSELTAKVNTALAKISQEERDSIMRQAIAWASGTNVEE